MGVFHEMNTRYIDAEFHTVNTLREFANEQDATINRLTCTVGAYEQAYQIIGRYPATSLRLFAAINHLTANGYTVEDITEIILQATKTGE